MGVSQTPLREALARLAAERLVFFEPYKGYSVTPLLTLRQLTELMHVRRLLETDAARLAAHRITLTDLHSMQKCIEQMEAVEPRPEFHDYLPFNRLDMEFHQRMFLSAENQLLLETYQGLNAHLWLARLDLTGHSIAARQSHQEHKAILQALKSHDPEAATRAVGQHIDSVEQRLGTYLQADELRVNLPP
jgi:DNA-binding GntR family transcriptional regulator